jgi:sulfate/thiosulfate-binding protein
LWYYSRLAAAGGRAPEIRVALFMLSIRMVIMRSVKLALVPALVLLASALAACGSSSSGGSKHLSLVAYSTPQAAYAALIPAFQATPTGKGITFSQSYGPSGDQSRAVLAGQPADVVALSLAPDVTKLAQAGMVSNSWDQDAYKGNVTDSVAVLVVRKGNPKHIQTWDDLVKPGVQVLTPNPLSSGSARWNVMAAYGSELKEGKSPAQGQAYLKALFHNVVSQDSSGRNALQTFLAGKGDVLISYENEAIAAQQKKSPVDYIIPRDTILIENPVAVVSKGGHTATAQAFVNFLRTKQAQQIFAAKGYRPVIAGLADPKRFPTPPGLFTIASLGGWKAVTKQFFDPTSGVVTKIEQGLGVSAAK